MLLTPLQIVALAVVVLILVSLIFNRLLFRLAGIVIVPPNSLGIVRKKFVLVGGHKTLPDGAIVALQGEAGLQADTLAPGLHMGLWVWQYDVEVAPFTTIPPGKVGIVAARDGVALVGGRILGKQVECDSFQDTREFLANHGERGPQLQILPPGVYRINTAMFNITSADAVEIPDAAVGVVTVKDGRPLNSAEGEIAGPQIEGHNSFQDGQAFLTAGGSRGLQEQVLLAGRYFLNPLFATVDLKPMTAVPIANVGVVIAYVGKPGTDVTGEAFKHGNLVSRGERGVWVEPLDPGMYPINPLTHKVEIVPTANVVLNWANGKTESHQLDKNLSTITVRSSDGFTFNLDVSQIIHIPRNDAPKVIARFGSMVNLVTQVLEPTIGNYFRNAAQKSDVIDFLTARQERQFEAKTSISGALKDYNVGAVDTLIGDITPPQELMQTLTDRKLATQRQQTFAVQRIAEDGRKDLEQSRALADTQKEVVAAERTVAIQEFRASAAVKTAEGEASAVKLRAGAEAEATTITGAAQASKTLAVGTAEADVIKLKIGSMASDNYARIEVAKALAGSGQSLVPEIIAGGDGTGAFGTILLASLVKDSLSKNGVEPKAGA